MHAFNDPQYRRRKPQITNLKSPITNRKSQITRWPISFSFLLSFHEHHGEKALTHLVSTTSWRGEKRTFFLYLFSITYGSLTPFFIPLFFRDPNPQG
jgi:hypothetical protein